ncbi:MAG TPA: beta-ketoacyl synthase N-terminal-like domain-containing protein [Streptosporangiaceae bacterium]|nr:beta-ketoacyl synthase N-terminal-like domain-containing protein [Streptosporangiaceae bacterium]
MTTAAPVITGWSAISPFGLDGHAFATGIREGRRTYAPVDHAVWPVPDEFACLVPGFNVTELLGNKGTRTMNRTTGLAVATAGQVLGPGKPTARAAEGTAFTLGTTTGSAQSMMDFTRQSLVGERPYLVEPALVPYGVMNVAAARCAIWHGLKGPNTTIATGRPAGISALSYARRLLATGRAERALAGAVEEYSVARSWLHHHSRNGNGGPLGEGAAIFVIEPASSATRRPLATLLATEFRTCVDGDFGTVIRMAIRAALARGGVSADEVFLASPSGAPGPAGLAERAALAEAANETAISRVPDLVELIADAGAASAAFQIAAVLSLAAVLPAAGKPALITSVDPDGAVACALLRLAEDPGPAGNPGE